MKKIIFFLLVIMFSGSLSAQLAHDALDAAYDAYRESSITHRRFKHKDIEELVKVLPQDLFEVENLGNSVEGRSINMVTYGAGDTHVLLWSQMHGNEPTATMAIMDIFRFLQTDDDFNDFRDKLRSSLTLHFIPMLNPDGADRFVRRNALDIDLNRDALRLQSPEAKILKSIRDRLDPTWGFNLHDQNRYSTAGADDHTASISFLAPAFNKAKDWSDGRTDAMQLIVSMKKIIENYLGKKIGRYSDTFEPRAFGDNIQKWGTNTILIETGGLKDDPEKQFLRKVNFVALLSAFQAIMTKSYEQHTLKEYNAIPFNGSYYHDLIIREVTIPKYGNEYIFDLAIRRSEINAEGVNGFYDQAYIADMGDLHNYYAYDDISLSGQKMTDGGVYGVTLDSIQQIPSSELLQLVKDGYIIFFCKNAERYRTIPLPLDIRSPGTLLDNRVEMNTNPTKIITDGGKVNYILCNGYIYDLEKVRQLIEDLY